jgi:16S rRNA (guanine966-N2)-methyltransferase
VSPSHDPFGRSRPAHDPSSQDEDVPRGKSAPRGREKVAAAIAASSKKKLPKVKPSKLRIIGGDLRGRGVLYLGDRDTRPMKESLREALFNIVGPAIKGRIAWDLFSGTGILAIESFSRGADYAVAIERSRFFARTIVKSAEAIGVTDEFLEVITGDAFRVSPGRMAEIAEQFPAIPWVVYFCPPYVLWTEQQGDMFELLETTAKLAPPGSLIVTETDKFFDIQSLPLGPWDVRPKGNMTLAFLETPPASGAA